MSNDYGGKLERILDPSATHIVNLLKGIYDNVNEENADLDINVGL